MSHADPALGDDAGRPAGRLPDFPWDRLAPSAAHGAARTPAGSSTCPSARRSTRRPPSSVQRCEAASDAPGYPQTYGTPALREAVAAWFARRRGVPGVDPDGVLPTIGSKELVAWLPTLLGLGPGDLVVHPEIAYPTYDVGARLAGATPLAADGTAQVGPAAGRVRLVWVNSPVATRRAACSASSTWRRSSRGRGRSGPSSRATSATPSSAGTAARCRASSTRGSAAARTQGLLAVYSASQAVEPRRLPGRLRRGRSGAGRGGCSRCASTPGMIVPCAGAGGDAGRSRRRRARGRAARALPGPARRWCAARSTRAGFAHRPLRGRALPVGDPGRALLGHASPRSPTGRAGRAG